MEALDLKGSLVEDLNKQITRDITEAEVHSVLNQLWSKKLNFNKEKVRELLGNRGSFVTITRYMDTWKQDTFPLPDGFDTLLKAYGSIHKLASRGFEVNLKTIKADYEAKLLEAQDAKDVVENQHQTALQDLELTKKEISELSNLHQKVTNLWQEEEKKRLVTEETNRQLQQQITDCKRNYQQQIATAFQQHEHQKQEWQTQQVLLQQSYDAKILELEEQLKKQEQLYRDVVEGLKLQNQRLELQVTQLNTENENQLTKFNLLSHQFKALEHSIKKHESVQLELNSQLQEKEKDLLVTNIENQHLQNKLDEDKQQIKVLHQSLLESNLKIGQLEEKLLQINNNIIKNNRNVKSEP